MRIAERLLFSIRVPFSIADIDSSQDDPEFVDEGAESGEAEAEHSFPVRVGITITKVSCRCHVPAFCDGKH